MLVGVTNPAGRDADQDFGRADLWKLNLGIFQRCADLHELDSSHIENLVFKIQDRSKHRTSNVEHPTPNAEGSV